MSKFEERDDKAVTPTPSMMHRSFEERLRLAAAQRAKVLAAKVRAARDVSPSEEPPAQVRKYVRRDSDGSGPVDEKDPARRTVYSSPGQATGNAPEAPPEASYGIWNFPPLRSQADLSRTTQADAPKVGVWSRRVAPVCAFLLGVAVGYIVAIGRLWSSM
jgi:hypothetical protein